MDLGIFNVAPRATADNHLIGYAASLFPEEEDAVVVCKTCLHVLFLSPLEPNNVKFVLHVTTT